MTVICRCGKAGETTVVVEAEVLVGNYAVHLTICNGSRGPGYSITHRKSGFAVWHVRELAAAVAVATWLDANLALPDTWELVTEWKATGADVKAKLVVALSEIAPREWVIA